MEERTKRFELLSDMYRFLHDLPEGLDRRDAGFRWFLNYARTEDEKLMLTVVDPVTGAVQPVTEIGVSGAARKAFRGTFVAHIDAARQTQAPVVWGRIQESDNALLREWGRMENIRTLWTFPLIAQGTVNGMLSIGYPDERDLTDVAAQYWRRVSESLALFVAMGHRGDQQRLHQGQLEATLRLTGSGVLGFGPTGDIAFHNERFLEIFHLEPQQVAGHYTNVLAHLRDQLADPDSVERTMDEVSRIARDPVEVIAELKGLVPRFIRMRMRPMGLADRMQGWLAIFDDYTDQRDTTTRHQAFLSLVAHEFRTPLTVISGVVEWLLSEGIADPAVSEQLQVVARESTRLTRLIREVWMNAHVDDPTWQGRETRISLLDMIRAEFNQRQLTAPDRHMIYHGPEHVEIVANQEVVNAIVAVLISNAVRFSPPNSAVDIAIREQEEMVRLRVADRGPGVAEDVLGDLFVRVPDPRRRSAVGGIGIGLWLSQQFLKKMGGRIDYEPRDGGGAVFTVWFPRQSPKTRVRRWSPE